MLYSQVVQPAIDIMQQGAQLQPYLEPGQAGSRLQTISMSERLIQHMS
jgi:hypothetical protein